MRAIEIEVEKGTRIWLPDPIPGLPSYATVIRAEARADELRLRLTENLDLRNPDAPYQADERLVFDFYEAAASVVVDGSAGLSSFASDWVRAWFAQHGLELDVAGRWRDEESVLQLSLDQLFGNVLPLILVRPLNRGGEMWACLRRVQALSALYRHGLTERRARNGLEGERRLFERFARGEYCGTARCMFDLFEHFAPGWIRSRFEDGPSKGETA